MFLCSDRQTTEQNKAAAHSNSLAQVWRKGKRKKVRQASQPGKIESAPTEDTASIFSLFQTEQAVSIHTPEINQQVIERVQCPPELSVSEAFRADCVWIIHQLVSYKSQHLKYHK